VESYDRHQFENSRSSQRIGYQVLDRQSFDRSHIIRVVGRSKRWIPEFAMNASQLQSVLLHATANYIFRSRKKDLPEIVASNLMFFDQLARDRQACMQAVMTGSADEKFSRMQAHFDASEHCGGYMPLIAAIAYRAWHLRRHSSDIANEVGVTTYYVEQLLHNLRRIAKSLGYSTVEPTRRKWEFKRADLVPQILALWEQGKSTVAIAGELDTRTATVRKVLRAHGVYIRRAAHPKGVRRPKTSALMKSRWSDPEYRAKRLKSIADGRLRTKESNHVGRA